MAITLEISATSGIRNEVKKIFDFSFFVYAWGFNKSRSLLYQ